MTTNISDLPGGNSNQPNIQLHTKEKLSKIPYMKQAVHDCACLLFAEHPGLSVFSTFCSKNRILHPAGSVDSEWKNFVQGKEAGHGQPPLL